MLKLHFNRIQAVFFIVLGIFLFISLVYSSDPFQTAKTCTDTWGTSCSDETFDDAFDPCNGTQTGTSEYVKEVYINASSFQPNDPINVTCKFQEMPNEDGVPTDEEYVYYYNTTSWIRVASWTGETGNTVNKSVTFSLNSTEGTHYVRCIIVYRDSGTVQLVSTEYCANDTTVTTGRYDNDDVNFTVAADLIPHFWNLTNYTTGAEIASGSTLTRSDLINVTANWTKAINNAFVEHNGTGTFVNYTISSFTGNWTNYTLNLSNISEFNIQTIGVRAIYANDTGYFGWNKTSPELYFTLDAGNPPNVTNFWFSRSGVDTNSTKPFNLLTIHANVSDDVGLDTVIANITYPNGTSINATMSGSSSYDEWLLWNLTFNLTLEHEQSGTYTVRIIARDIGGQEKTSGTDYDLENMTFSVTPLSGLFGTTRTCSDTFGLSCNSDDTNDTNTDDCIGTHSVSQSRKIQEVYINGNYFFPGDGIKVTCEFFESTAGDNYEYIWYYNTTTWINIWNGTGTLNEPVNKSVVFNLNYSEGTHIVRCIYSYDNPVDDECADSGLVYDNQSPIT